MNSIRLIILYDYSKIDHCHHLKTIYPALIFVDHKSTFREITNVFNLFDSPTYFPPIVYIIQISLIFQIVLTLLIFFGQLDITAS